MPFIRVLLYFYSATTTSEILPKLNISFNTFPHKYQQLLQKVAILKASSGIQELDTVSISQHQCREIEEKLDEEYEILELRSKIKKIQAAIDSNNVFLEQLRIELQQSRERLLKQTPNPACIQEYCQEVRLKLVTYEKNEQKAEAKFAKLCVPDHVMPYALHRLVESLAEVCEEATALRRSAEDITLTRQARQVFSQLKK